MKTHNDIRTQMAYALFLDWISEQSRYVPDITVTS